MSPKRAGEGRMQDLNRKQILMEALLICLLFVLSFLFLSYKCWVGLNRYDEGIQFYAAWAYSRGTIPFLDLHCIYPPGRFYIYSWLAGLIGWEILTFRYVMVVTSSIICVLVFLLASRISRRVFALLAWALSLVYFFEYLSPALMIVVFFLTASYFKRPHAAKVFMSGLLVGIITWCRQDFGFYACLAALLPFALWAQVQGRGRSLPRRLLMAVEGLGFFALGVAAFIAPWGILYLTIAPERFIYSFIKMPLVTSHLRAMPYPVPWGEVPALLSGKMGLSAFIWNLLVEIWPYYAPFALIALSFVFLCKRRGGLSDFTPWDYVHTYVAFYALVLFNYARVVTNLWHLVPMALFASVLASPLLMDTVQMIRERRRLWPALASLVLLLTVASGAGIVFLKMQYLRATDFTAEELRIPRARGIRVNAELASNYRHVVSYIKNRTAPDEKIYVGLLRHDVVAANDIMLAFLAERELSTRYYHFDPGVQTTAAVQEEMIWELEKHRVRYAVLWGFRPARKFIRKNLEMGGAHLLDDYLKEHFQTEINFGEYFILRRKKR